MVVKCHSIFLKRNFTECVLFRCEELCAKFEKENDDYNIIMAKALADRLAEAFAEGLHEIVRTALWGYCSEERLAPSELHGIKYKVMF